MKVLFLILRDLCLRTAPLSHPLPVSQVGSPHIQVRLHYIDGNYTVLPEVVEASLGPYMQVILDLLDTVLSLYYVFFSHLHVNCCSVQLACWQIASCYLFVVWEKMQVLTCSN